jgi:hypothetical protein
MYVCVCVYIYIYIYIYITVVIGAVQPDICGLILCGVPPHTTIKVQMLNSVG